MNRTSLHHGQVIQAGSEIRAGFPSPAESYMEEVFDLNERLIQHPAATFLVQVCGDSMIGAGIHHGDKLIVDRSLKPGDGKIVVANLEGEFVVKRLRIQGNRISLLSENPHFKTLEIGPENQFEIWGVVTYSIHSV